MIRQSELMEWRDCRQKWLLRWYLGLDEKTKEQEPIQFGSAWGSIMDAIWEHRFSESMEPFTRMDIEFSLNQYLMEADIEGEPEWFDLIVEMAERYIDESETLKFAERRIGTEQEVSASGIICGHIDKVIYANGEVWLVDHKTTSKRLDEWERKNGTKPQLSFYSLLSHIGAGVKPAGVIWDVARKAVPAKPEDYKTIKKGALSKVTPKEATPEGWRKACAKNIAELSVEGKPAKEPDWYAQKLRDLEKRDTRYFDMMVYRISDEELERTAQEARITALEVASARASLIGKKPEKADFPRNAQACYRYNRECPVAHYCKHGFEPTNNGEQQ